ncbi:MAG: 30S ribosomal protein S2, partial [Elusimicrobiota bacterium]|nr:30S ribosomal protein S2 [Elusimicrobiota bacterium]
SIPYVHEKWLGGMLTNFETLKSSIKRLEELEKLETDGLFKVMSKKEVSRLVKEKNRLIKLLSGIRHMPDLPKIMFVIDPMEEIGAMKEAKKLGITIVSVCDTNCDPDDIDVPIPGNDDASRSIRLFCATMADAIIDGRKEKDDEEMAVKQAEEDAKKTEEAAAQQAEMEAANAVEETPTETEKVKSVDDTTDNETPKTAVETESKIEEPTEPKSDIETKTEAVKTEE